MLTQICAEIHNYFSFQQDRFFGDFEIIDGSIVPSVSMLDNQYYRIVGSVFNDGVHKYGDADDILVDEPKFNGAVWLMRVPEDFIKLVDEIKAWQDKNGDIVNSPYQSESFGGYSYTKASGNSNGDSYGWKNVFGARLNRYRKISEL